MNQLNIEDIIQCLKANIGDFHELSIFQRIKNKLKNRGVELKILLPPPPHQYLPSATFMHKSSWNYKIPFSGSDQDAFSSNEQKIINKLIKEDLWIEEETNVLKDMYFFNLTENSK